MSNKFDIEQKIVADIRNGSKKAFSSLFEQYVDKVYYGCIRSSLSHEDAQEITQEVFLKIWENRAALDETKSINAFIFTISKNFILKRIRKQAYTIVLEKYWKISSPQITQNTEEEIAYKDLQRTVQNIVDYMPEKQREIFLLRLHEGLTSDEIASRLKLSKRTVENQIYRALKKLKFTIR